MGAVSGLARYLEGWSPPARRWRGRVAGWSVSAFAALLDQPDPLREHPVVPPMWQLFGCLAHPAQAELGDDGHPSAGPFLPPIPHRRRMFAGGRWREARPLPVDQPVDCAATVTSVRVTEGRSGELAFVTVRTECSADGEPAVAEEQDLVYRSQPEPPASPAAPAPSGPPRAAEDEEPSAEHELTLTPDETLLFRFSALTYNAHRIHYDHRYATQVEGYSGLVVHGPLLALLGLELPRRHRADQRVGAVDYRLRRPAFAGSPVRAWSLPGRRGGEWELRAGAAGAPPSLTATARPGPVELAG